MDPLAPAAPPDEPPTYFYIGHHESRRRTPVTAQVLNQAQDAGYDMVTQPITTPSFQMRVLAALDTYLESGASAEKPEDVPFPLIEPFTPDDTPLLPDEAISSMLAMTSPWIDLASCDPAVAHVSRQVFNHEIAYAAFCGVNNIIVQGPSLQTGSSIPQFARAMTQALNVGPYINIQVLLPMLDSGDEDVAQNPRHLASRARPEYAAGADIATSGKDHLKLWDAWDVIRSTCKFHSRLSVALRVPRQLPDDAIQSRWFSEPVRILEFHQSAFVNNAKGFPVLSKTTQALITRFMRLRTPPWLLLTDVGPIPGENEKTLPISNASPASSSLASPATSASAPTPAEASQTPQQRAQKRSKDLTPHLGYLRHLQRTQPPRSIIERFATGYQDFLQSPLQPLTDNLESITYEVFEKDPIKYEWYERAVAAALHDLHAQLKRDIVVAVVGAGRGPLMTRALRASASTGISILPYAVEKNPNAYVVLQHHNATNPLWGNRVKITKTDMRAWAGPVLPTGEVGKVDILISELLGSFADNELSPECLDGVQHVLDPTHGVSIPTSYTAHFTPIASPKIHADLLSRAGAGAEDRWELPYVTMLHQYDDLCILPSSSNQRVPDVRTAWEFTHPLPPAILAQSALRRGGSVSAGGGGAVGGDGWNEHNARFSRSRFTCSPARGVMHGLAGYFETVLYRSPRTGEAVELSTNPVTMEAKSKDMISWFPIFFPLKQPLCVPAGAQVEVSMWRMTDDRKVWYEWLVEVFAEVGGQRIRVAGSELHSSVKNGCLM